MDTQTRIGDRADSLSLPCLFLDGRQGIDQSVQAFTISVGEDFMFLISFSGSVWSWGRNTFGQVRPQQQLGGTNTAPFMTPGHVWMRVAILDRDVATKFSPALAVERGPGAFAHHPASQKIDQSAPKKPTLFPPR